jgi:hypothetical protein
MHCLLLDLLTRELYLSVEPTAVSRTNSCQSVVVTKPCAQSPSEVVIRFAIKGVVGKEAYNTEAHGGEV